MFSLCILLQFANFYHHEIYFNPTPPAPWLLPDLRKQNLPQWYEQSERSRERNLWLYGWAEGKWTAEGRWVGSRGIFQSKAQDHRMILILPLGVTKYLWLDLKKSEILRMRPDVFFSGSQNHSFFDSKSLCTMVNMITFD